MGRNQRSPEDSLIIAVPKGRVLQQLIPRFQRAGIDTRAPDPASWRIVVPEQPQALENVALIGGRVAAQYLVDVSSRLRLFGLDGTPQEEIALPGVGSVFGLSGRQDTSDVWYAFSSPLMPTSARSMWLKRCSWPRK